MVAPICSSVQLPFIYLNLSTILVPSVRFSCRSQVSYHIFVCFTSLQEQAPQGWPNVSYLEHSSRKARCPISVTLVPRPINLDMSLLLLLHLQGCTIANAHPILHV